MTKNIAAFGWAGGLCPTDQRGHGGTQRRQLPFGGKGFAEAAGRSPRRQSPHKLSVQTRFVARESRI